MQPVSSVRQFTAPASDNIAGPGSRAIPLPVVQIHALPADEEVDSDECDEREAAEDERRGGGSGRQRCKCSMRVEVSGLVGRAQKRLTVWASDGKECPPKPTRTVVGSVFTVQERHRTSRTFVHESQGCVFAAAARAGAVQGGRQEPGNPAQPAGVGRCLAGWAHGKCRHPYSLGTAMPMQWNPHDMMRCGGNGDIAAVCWGPDGRPAHPARVRGGPSSRAALSRGSRAGVGCWYRGRRARANGGSARHIPFLAPRAVPSPRPHHVAPVCSNCLHTKPRGSRRHVNDGRFSSFP